MIASFAKQWCLVFLATAAAFLSWKTTCMAGIPAEEFLKQYEVKSKLLRDFYGNITIQAEETRIDHNGTTSTSALVYYGSKADNLRIDYLDRQGLNASLVYSPDLSFQVGKDSPSKGYALMDLQQSKSQDMLESLRMHRVPLAPTSFMELDILEFLQSKDRRLSIKSIHDIDYHGISALLLEFTCGHKDRPIHGSFTFFKDSLALLAYQYGGVNFKGTINCVLTYEGNDSQTGLPLFKEIDYWQEDLHGVLAERETFHVTRLTPGAASESLFKPAAFNLPNPVEKPHINYHALCLSLIALFFVTGLALYRITARRKSKSQYYR